MTGTNLSLSGSAAGLALTLNEQPVSIISASATQVIIQIPPGNPAGPAQLKLNNGAADAFPIVIDVEAQ